MKKNTIITMVVCALLIAATIGGLVWYDKAEKAKADGATGTGGSSSSSTPTPIFPLLYGSRGANVRTLQTKMNEWMAYNWFSVSNKPKSSRLTVDGIFGPKTQEFVSIIFGTLAVTESEYNTFIAKQMGVETVTYPKLY